MATPPPTPPLPRSLATDLADRTGATVRVCGWAEPTAADGAPSLVLRDRRGRVTLVDGTDAEAGTGPLAAALVGLVAESAVEAVGVVAAPSGDGHPEITVAEVRVVGPAVAEVPIDEHSPVEERLDWRFLDLRRRSARLVFEVQTTAERAMRAFWEADGCIELHSPKIRAVSNRSGRELFTIDYFGRPAYLAQSPQFHKQMAMAAGFDRVFEVGPVFRANPHATDRHDTEFTSVDMEISWISSHEDVMALEERWLRDVIAAVADQHGDDIRRTFGVEVNVPELPFPRVPMEEAYDILRGRGWVGPHRPGDIDREGEQLLAAHVAATHGHEFVFVTEYGAAVRPFYHMLLEDGSTATRGFDLLWKGLEVTTGAQREHRYERLVDQAASRGIELAPIQFYLDYFKFGCPPHGGFGLGLTRALMSILGIDDVREVTYLHRGPNRIAP
jgi:aspartyl-tRNA synthetase